MRERTKISNRWEWNPFPLCIIVCNTMRLKWMCSRLPLRLVNFETFLSMYSDTHRAKKKNGKKRRIRIHHRRLLNAPHSLADCNWTMRAPQQQQLYRAKGCLQLPHFRLMLSLSFCFCFILMFVIIIITLFAGMGLVWFGLV